jgi:hypothetical protein
MIAPTDHNQRMITQNQQNAMISLQQKQQQEALLTNLAVSSFPLHYTHSIAVPVTRRADTSRPVSFTVSA